MAAFARFAVIGFLVLTVIYVSVSMYSRAARRDKLIRQWEEEGRPGDRDAYLREGLAEYDDSFRKKLLLLIYIVPTVAVAAIIYLTN